MSLFESLYVFLDQPFIWPEHLDFDSRSVMAMQFEYDLRPRALLRLRQRSVILPRFRILRRHPRAQLDLLDWDVMRLIERICDRALTPDPSPIRMGEGRERFVSHVPIRMGEGRERFVSQVPIRMGEGREIRLPRSRDNGR